MGIFIKLNKKPKRIERRMRIKGITLGKSDRRCENCSYFSSSGNCGYYDKMTNKENYCSNYLRK